MNASTIVLKFAPGLLALALLLAVSPVKAADSSPVKSTAPTKAELKNYDANGDGQLDETERAKMKEDAKARRDAKRAENLAKYDADGNHKLSKAEKEKMKADKEAERAGKKAAKDAALEAKEMDAK